MNSPASTAQLPSNALVDLAGRSAPALLLVLLALLLLPTQARAQSLPADPSWLRVTAASCSEIDLLWQDNSTDESGFRIERKEGAAGPWTLIASVGADVVSYRDSGLTQNTTYAYRVWAFNAAGESRKTNEANTTTPSCPSVPADPSWLRVTATFCSEIDLLWNDNSSNEDGFRIERKEGSAGSWTLIASVGANVVSFQDSGLTQNTTYAYRVWAFNAGGDSGKTNEAGTTTPGCATTLPADPSWLRVTTASCSRIDLVWDDNSTNEDGFRIERKEGPAGPWALIASVGTDVTSFQDSALSQNTTYAYRVWAFNAAGDSGKTNEAGTTTSACSDTEPPVGVPSLQATPFSSSWIDLAWQDASDNEDGFRIERRTGSTGTWGTVATAPRDATTHQDTGLPCETSFTYRVVAFNTAGDAPASPEATATTTTCPPASNYPLAPSDICGNGWRCDTVIDLWNDATWTHVVADNIDPQGTMAAVRKYVGEHEKVFSPPPGCPLSTNDDANFCSATDEHSNVLLNHAMGSDRASYDKLHRFTELLRHGLINGLQCWRFQVKDGLSYSSASDVCFDTPPDSAADASLRILGAYGIACAKRLAGIWSGGLDYCADYDQQALAIFGNLLPGGTGHGEIKLHDDGRYYLAGGYNNWNSAPDGTDASFWPDYHELQFLMDYARYRGSPVEATVEQVVLDLLENYRISLAGGANHVHKGKRGRFDVSGTTPTYVCVVDCSPLGDLDFPYMDFPDTWRAVPALSGLLNVHSEVVSSASRTDVFDYWWSHYAGGSVTYGPNGSKPFEIYWNDPAVVKQSDAGYRGTAMWIPLGAAQRDVAYTTEAVRYLVEDRYLAAEQRFMDAAYFGSYASQFTQRAIGAATGMIDPAFWCPAEFD